MKFQVRSEFLLFHSQKLSKEVVHLRYMNFLNLVFTPCKAEQPLGGKKKEERDEKAIGMPKEKRSPPPPQKSVYYL